MSILSEDPVSTRQEILQVLIVEDELLIAAEIEKRLSRIGHKVIGIATSAEEAVSKAIDMTPDLILMDVKLDGPSDGIAAASEIRSRLEVPIIYLTSYTDSDTLERAKSTDPFGYIVKPLTENALPVAIEMALSKFDLQQKAKAAAAWFFAVLRSISDGFIGINQDGDIWFVNPAAESLLGCSEESVLGRAVSTVVKLVDEKTNYPRSVLENLYLLGEGLASTGILISADGRRIPIEKKTAPIRVADLVLGSIWVLRDLSARQVLTSCAGQAG